jgi:hypothetical protein
MAIQALALGLFDGLVDDHSLAAATRRLLQLVGAYYVAALRTGAIDRPEQRTMRYWRRRLRD